jgi:hypothetical protein
LILDRRERRLSGRLGADAGTVEQRAQSKRANQNQNAAFAAEPFQLATIIIHENLRLRHWFRNVLEQVVYRGADVRLHDREKQASSAAIK